MAGGNAERVTGAGVAGADCSVCGECIGGGGDWFVDQYFDASGEFPMISAPFGRVIRPPFGPALASERWWLAGGIPAANCIAAYQPKRAASYAASKVNLANPGTYDATEGVAPSWSSAVGWTFNGSSQYLDTGIVIPAGGKVYSFFEYSSDVDGAYDMSIWGATASSDAVYLRIIHNYLSGTRVLYQWYLNYNRTPKNPSGTFAMCGNATNCQCYFNGAADGSPFSHGWPGAFLSIYLGAIHKTTGPVYGIGKLHAFAVYNTTLTAAQVAAIHAAVTAL